MDDFNWELILYYFLRYAQFHADIETVIRVSCDKKQLEIKELKRLVKFNRIVNYI